MSYRPPHALLDLEWRIRQLHPELQPAARWALRNVQVVGALPLLLLALVPLALWLRDPKLEETIVLSLFFVLIAGIGVAVAWRRSRQINTAQAVMIWQRRHSWLGAAALVSLTVLASAPQFSQGSLLALVMGLGLAVSMLLDDPLTALLRLLRDVPPRKRAPRKSRVGTFHLGGPLLPTP